MEKLKNLAIFAISGLISLSVFSPRNAQAKSFHDACPDLQACMQAVSALTHDHYIYSDVDVKVGKPQTTDNLELTASNANLLFTTFLHMNYLSRVPVDAQTFRIMRENDAKGAAVPRFQASAIEDAKLPETADMVNLTYTATHPEAVKSMENTIRTFTNMGARIYGDTASGTLMITSNANEIAGLIPMMRKLDVKIEKAKPSETLSSKAHLEKKPSTNATPDPK
jgi:hypothetical protein